MFELMFTLSNQLIAEDTGTLLKFIDSHAAACKERGLWPFTHFNRVHVVPPCTITSAEVQEGIAILDETLGIADGYYSGG